MNEQASILDNVSSAEDFKKHAIATAFEAPERVPLPSGLVVMLRRPKPTWWMLQRGILPASMAAGMTDGSLQTTESDEERIAAVKFVVELVEQVVVQPKVRRDPGLDELNPNLINDEDFTFIINYASGGEKS